MPPRTSTIGSSAARTRSARTTEVLNEARGWIPENGSYRLLVGPSSTDIDFRNYARYFLMPRRPAPDARWVLCYECDLSRLGSELDVVWKDNEGVLLGRLPA